MTKMKLSVHSHIISVKIQQRVKSSQGQYNLFSRETFKKDKKEAPSCVTERKAVPSFIKAKKTNRQKNITKT